MGNNKVYIHKMAGLFPEANSVEDFWLNILHAKVAKKTQLDSYWQIKKETYSNSNTDQYISMDHGHIVEFKSKEKIYPRQIQGAIEVGSKLLENFPNSERNLGLIVATEWTDPSFYNYHLGKISKEFSYDIERQINAIKIGLKITGPALAVDTACASSLYGIELARGMLNSSSLDGVIVLGLNLYLHSFLYRGFSKLGALSKSGSLRSFDKEADGIVPGEAVCGILVNLEPIKAIAEISGIGLSSDGNEGSPFSPGYEGQLSAYKRAYIDANISPQEIDYIEAHGTATVLGDETECRSLQSFFKPTESKKLIIGSSKANIGHTLAASGLVAIIKSALIIKHKTLPPHIKINPSPHLKRRGIETIETPRQMEKDIIKVGVSSFGFGGSNAHLILQTPTERVSEAHPFEKKFFIQKLEFIDGIKTNPPIIENVPMGPKMQGRIDFLQRWALKLTQEVLKTIPQKEQEKLSCLFLNNLGGRLSLEFEKKYAQSLDTPELSIEAISSTLPSMLSGFPSLLFNFRGTHMLVSGGNGSLGELLLLCPYLLTRFEGDLILGFAYQNLETKTDNDLIGILHITRKNDIQSMASVSIEENPNRSAATNLRHMGECTGITELFEGLSKNKTSNNINLGKYIIKISQNDSHNQTDARLKESISRRSQENKEIVLDYLNLLHALLPQKKERFNVGDFIINCTKSSGTAEGELVVDETHPYFFDHPLDHVPGILTIHGAEELLHWYLGEDYFVKQLNIRFSHFLEKNKPIKIKLKETHMDEFECEVYQQNLRAGVLKMSVKKRETISFPTQEKIDYAFEEKKFLHKSREENVLISKLDEVLEGSWALCLKPNRGNFFLQLNKPSSLYYAEISRQFVMLLAHHKKKIPLSTKMNLLITEVKLEEYFPPPFKLQLKDFELTESQDFLIADIFIHFSKDGRFFGEGRIKAQVVSNEYYSLQRNKV